MSRAASTVAAAAAFLVLAAGGVLLTAAPASADTDDFTVTSFTADYYLGVDPDGRSILKTVETIVARFPDYDQNHGILRDLIDRYDGHPTNIDVQSVTDAGGSPVPWDSERDDDALELKIGDADRYVRGEQTYVISYLSHNVTRFFGDTGADEFYWDTNGSGWYQPFGSITARVHIPAALADSLTGTTACYRGYEGSHDPCDSETTTVEDDGVVYEATAAGLAANQNLSFAIGFDEGTFVERDPSPWASPFFYLELLLAVVAVVIAVVMLVLRGTVFADAPGRPTIVAEYIEPKGTTALMAGIATKRTKRAVAAQLISFAVRHNMRIIEQPSSGLFSTGPDYLIELVSIEGLVDEELELAKLFFGYSLVPGTQYRIRKNDTTVGAQVFRLIRTLDAATVTRGYQKSISVALRFFPLMLAAGSAIGTVVFAFLLLDDGRIGNGYPFIAVVLAVVAAVVVLAIARRRPYTAKGAELRDYLKGLLLYIQVAETDRIRILQSPEGAERTPVDTTDRGEMLKLYERILPFAVLFDEEKRWAKELGDYYDQQPPDWYSGSGAFSTLAFASSIGSVSSLSSSSFSGSSSSSGGSGGGGSSGGGGGGGGGGGW